VLPGANLSVCETVAETIGHSMACSANWAACRSGSRAAG
jgi:hypothetical protein